MSGTCDGLDGSFFFVLFFVCVFLVVFVFFIVLKIHEFLFVPGFVA